MVQCRGRTGLLREALQTFAIRRIRCRQHFDGDDAIEARIVGAVHFAHPARTEHGLDFVRA